MRVILKEKISRNDEIRCFLLYELIKNCFKNEILKWDFNCET